ncbi:MAG: response regulator transcription factor [Candidatus Gastranaerophilales bacterium]|nr:response regulator transcription factor [Candidatus Gastranaerophilales bacterium]
MKKIGFANPNSALLGYLIEQLNNAPEKYKGVYQLSAALTELMDGDCDSLLLELDGQSINIENQAGGGIMQFGDLSIIQKLRKVIRNGQKIDLTPKEFDILYFLATNKGEVFTKEQIYEEIWECDFLQGDCNIMTFIRRLRKKIEPFPDDPKYILTVWGIGYKFNEEL